MNEGLVTALADLHEEEALSINGQMLAASETHLGSWNMPAKAWRL